MASICLVLGILRKELTSQLLIVLAVIQYGPSASNLLLFMSPLQLFVFGLVMLYFPCVATMSVFARELGRKSMMTMMVSTIALAILIGAIAYSALPALGLLTWAPLRTEPKVIHSTFNHPTIAFVPS